MGSPDEHHRSTDHCQEHHGQCDQAVAHFRRFARLSDGDGHRLIHTPPKMPALAPSRKAPADAEHLICALL